MTQKKWFTDQKPLTASEKIGSLINALWSFVIDGGSYFGSGSFMSESAFAKAERENLTVVLPNPNQLFIDIDNDLSMAIYEKNFNTFAQWYFVDGSPVIVPSKSGGDRKHITITLGGPIDPIERLILQAFLGSDLKREFLGLQRIKNEDPHPTLFLEKKERASDLSIPYDGR